MANIFTKLFGKKEAPAPVHVPTEFELRAKVMSFGRIVDNYTRLCENNIEKHARKAIEYKMKNNPFAKKEINRIASLRKNMQTAQGYKDMMEHYFEDYQNGMLNIGFMKDMNSFTKSMQTAMASMQGIDMNAFMQDMFAVNQSIAETDEKLSSAMSIFDSLSAVDSAQQTEAEAEIDAIISRVISDGALSAEGASVDDYVKQAAELIL